jgi:hypothetical protein
MKNYTLEQIIKGVKIYPPKNSSQSRKPLFMLEKNDVLCFKNSHDELVQWLVIENINNSLKFFFVFHGIGKKHYVFCYNHKSIWEQHPDWYSRKLNWFEKNISWKFFKRLSTNVNKFKLN